MVSSSICPGSQVIKKVCSSVFPGLQVLPILLLFSQYSQVLSWMCFSISRITCHQGGSIFSISKFSGPSNWSGFEKAYFRQQYKNNDMVISTTPHVQNSKFRIQNTIIEIPHFQQALGPGYYTLQLHSLGRQNIQPSRQPSIYCILNE